MRTFSKEEIRQIIEGKGRGERIPMLYDLWIYGNVFGEDAQAHAKWQSQYPCDVDSIFLNMPGLAEGPAEDPGGRRRQHIPGSAPWWGWGLPTVPLASSCQAGQESPSPALHLLSTCLGSVSWGCQERLRHCFYL